MKFKKRLAVLLSAAMVMGMTVPAGATVLSTNEVPGGDSKTGTGSIEKHLDKEVANIILPTISDNAFDFTVDPERLVKDTGGARFAAEGQEVVREAMNAGVFFQVSDNKYDSKTPEFEFENRSTFAIDLTVQVEAQHNVEENDLALLSYNELTNPTEPGLFLGLNVGKDNDTFATGSGSAIKYDEPAKKTVSVNGVEANYIVSWNSTDKYHMIVVDSPSNWSKGKFQIEGWATEGKDITDDTSAPKINVTWSWKKYGDTSEAANKIVIAGSDIYFKLFADTSSVTASKLGTVKVNNVEKAATVDGEGVIVITGGAPTAGDYTVTAVYDGTTYTKKGTK